MVLEHIIPEKIIEKKLIYAFLLGVIYSIIGIFVAAILFPADPSLVAVALTSILLIPAIRKIYSIEEKQAKRAKKFSLRTLWKNEHDFIKVYLVILLGVFLVYSISAIILPSFQINALFREQLELRGAGAVDNIAGQAFSQDLFFSILINNFLVMLACLLLSFFTGDGGIFLLTWNASLWGTVFGVTARNASIVSHQNPLLLLLIVLVIVLPHAFLEILSYILAAISGGLMSSDIEFDPGEKRKEQFKSYYWKSIVVILLFALIILVLGVLVETFVLENVSTYSKIIEQSYLV